MGKKSLGLFFRWKYPDIPHREKGRFCQRRTERDVTIAGIRENTPWRKGQRNVEERPTQRGGKADAALCIGRCPTRDSSEFHFLIRNHLSINGLQKRQKGTLKIRFSSQFTMLRKRFQQSGSNSEAGWERKNRMTKIFTKHFFCLNSCSQALFSPFRQNPTQTEHEAVILSSIPCTLSKKSRTFARK